MIQCQENVWADERTDGKAPEVQKKHQANSIRSAD